MSRVWAQLTPTERSHVETHLEAASFAIWEARHDWGEVLASRLSPAQWRRHLSTAQRALRAADAVVTRNLVTMDPGL
jgi:hypothetical protein